MHGRDVQAPRVDVAQRVGLDVGEGVEAAGQADRVALDVAAEF